MNEPRVIVSGPIEANPDYIRLKKLRDDLVAGNAAPLHIEPPVPVESIGLPKIMGHQLTPREWDAFEAYTRFPTLKQAAEECGISVITLRAWRQESWWAELFRIFIQDRQQDLHAGLVALTEDAIDTMGKILRGELDMNDKGIGEAKYANAQIQAVQLLTKIGKAPLQDNRSITNIDGRSVINTGTVHISREKIGELDQDTMLKMVTGEVKIE